MTGTFFSWIVTAISAADYGGIIGLMTLESACIPLPSEVIMPFSGYLASTGQFTLIGVALAGTAGCNMGGTLSYLVGAYGGRPAVLRWGRYVLLSRGELDRLDHLFHRYGGVMVLIGRLLPGVRTYISLPAGIARMPFPRIQLYTFAGSLPWCYGLAYLGYKLGQQWNSNPTVQSLFSKLDWVVAAFVAILFAFYIYWRWREAAK